MSKVIFFWDAEQRVGLSFIVSTSLRFYDLFNRGFPSGSSCKESTCQCRRQETLVWFLGQEDPWRRKWQPIPVFLPQKFHGWRSLAGYSPTELDMTEHAYMHLLLFLMASRLARLVPSWLLRHTTKWRIKYPPTRYSGYVPGPHRVLKEESSLPFDEENHIGPLTTRGCHMEISNI